MAFEPRVPLVHVVGTKEVAALPCDGVESGSVEITEVGGEAFGGAEGSTDLLHREAAAGLIVEAGASEEAYQRELAEDQVLDFQRSEFAPAPLR